MTSRAIPGLLLVSAALLAGCLEFGGEDGGPPATGTGTPEATATPTGLSEEEAIAGFVRESQDREYAGDCARAQEPADVGKICTSFKGERGEQRAYVAGPTFSEFDLWLFLVNTPAGWQATGTYPLHPDSIDVPGVPWPKQAGDEVVVTGTGQCLNVREGPGLEAAPVDCLTDGTKVILAQGPIEGSGFHWWRIEGRAGWVAADWLRYPDEAAAVPTPQPSQ